MVESRPLYTVLKLLQEQDLLKGDLNVGQRLGLYWIMNRDLEDIVLMEKMRMQATALAGSSASDSFARTLLEDDQEKTPEEEVQDFVEWKQPQSIEELEELERLLAGN